MKTNHYQIVRKHQLRRNRRAAILASLGAFILAFGLLHQQPTVQPQPTNWGNTRTFSAEMSQSKLLAVEQASDIAFGHLLRGALKGAGDAALSLSSPDLRSSADLVKALQQELEAAHDPYATLIRQDAYDTMAVLRCDKKIGVDLDLRYGQNDKGGYYCALPLQNESELAVPSGIKAGDVVTKIDGLAVKASSSDGYATAQNLQRLLDGGGPLGSVVSVTIMRDKATLEIQLVRQEVKDEDDKGGVFVSNVFMPNTSRSSRTLPQAKSMDIANLYNEKALPRLIAALTELKNSATPTRGLVLDLTRVNGSDAETALRVAALFLGHGKIAQRLAVADGGGLELKTWEIVDSKVVCRTRGPLLVDESGSVSDGPKTTEQVETLDWPCNLFSGEIVVVIGKNTSGGGEVIAAALQNDAARCVVAGESKSAGKGLAQTCFQIGNGMVLCVSTDLYMQPNGQAIEGQGIAPGVVIPQEAQDAYVVAGIMQQRFLALPNPPPPVADEPETDSDMPPLSLWMGHL